MASSSYDYLIATLLLVAALGMVILFIRYKRSNTKRRMMAMLKRAGLDPEIARQGDTRAVIDAIRKRCGMCQAEDICERWLAGEIEGDNDFCPNAEVFKTLAGRVERTA